MTISSNMESLPSSQELKCSVNLLVLISIQTGYGRPSGMHSVILSPSVALIHVIQLSRPRSVADLLQFTNYSPDSLL